MELLWQNQVGKKSRSVGATLMNQDSSRSHSIFTITVEASAHRTLAETDGSMHIRVGKLNLVIYQNVRLCGVIEPLKMAVKLVLYKFCKQRGGFRMSFYFYIFQSKLLEDNWVRWI